MTGEEENEGRREKQKGERARAREGDVMRDNRQKATEKGKKRVTDLGMWE